MSRAAAQTRQTSPGPSRAHEASFTIVPAGPFSLQESAEFGFGHRIAPTWDGVMRLAFCLDGDHDQVGVEVRQDSAGVHGLVRAQPGTRVDLDATQAQVARVLSLDHDAEGYVAVGDRDPMVRRLLAAAPGLRPVLFHSPYEAAAWAVLSARRPARQMAEVRRRLAEQHGATFELAGESMAAFPTPEQLLGVTTVPGLTADKVTRLHAVARAALAGKLDVSRLMRMPPDVAMEDVQSLPGIGPFYSALIVVRATGHADVLPTDEPRLRALVTQLYGLPDSASPADLARVAEPWRPFRTWVAVLIRAAADRLEPGDDAEP